MRRPDDITLPLVGGVTPTDARRARAHATRVSAWMTEVWAAEGGAPEVDWSTLASLPDWALGTPAALERLALLAGALFAAPSLRVCLDPGPLLRVRELIGAAALDQVLAVPGLPPMAPPWPAAEGGEHDTLHAWGSALLVTSLGDAALRATLARQLGVPAQQAPLLPAAIATRMVQLALHILTLPPPRQPVPEEAEA